MSVTTRSGRRRFVTPLDRYVASEFFTIFVVTVLGMPVLVFVVDLVENLKKYNERKLGLSTVALSYWYFIPDTMFMVLPAAVLFATVFSIGNFTRYAEITAAKASGISFYRFIAPIVLMSFGAMLLGLLFSELAPPSNAKRIKLLEGTTATRENTRYNFAFASEGGRVYRVYSLDVAKKAVENIEAEERGSKKRPGVLIAAKTGLWHADRGWILSSGVLHVIPNDSLDLAFSFDSIADRRMLETPLDLRASEREPSEMDYRELTHFIRTLERSGADVNSLKVERMLKIAVPVTCIIIALFGAPLATSSQRGGAAFGVAISLATTVLMLVLIQLTKAIGAKGILPPEVAAWMPNALVGVIALVLLARVRT